MTYAMASRFVHLHVHTEYSLLDGLPKIAKLVKKAKEMEMDSLAITDHGAMYGAIEFYKAAQKEGIKPIIGFEAYTTNKDHKIKKEENVRGADANHLLLLAKNETGYRNLMKLTSIAHIEGYYYKPRFNKELLKQYSQGIICTSACPLGELGQALANDNFELARKTAVWFQEVFGDDYYLEVQRHMFEEQIEKASISEIKDDLRKMSIVEKKINEGVVKISRDLGIPIVATNDSHYTNKEDAIAQDVMVCVSTGKLVSETKRIRFVDNPNFYVKSSEEMKELFLDLPEAIENTVKIAEKCDLQISTMGKWFFPKFPVPESKDESEYMRELVKHGAKEKFGEVTPEIKERLEHELEIIINKGYVPYFLITYDFVNWANEQGIITNTRGSAAGSLVSFCLGITTVNPLTYNLPFERFLNPFRPTPPDIDFDVSDNRREDIINYITKKYGQDKVAQICTFGRMLSRAAVRDIARVLGYPYAIGDRISKLIPPPKQGFPIDVPRALKESPDLAQLYNSDADSKKILDLAHEVEGSARHLSVHAAGLVVAQTEMTDFSPLQLDPSGERVITQYEMHACEDVGLIKFDILGIRNLSILGASVEIVKKNRNINIDLSKIPLDDKKTYEMLSRGETMGVFQLGGSGMTRFLKELKPERIEDLMAMVALFRPGPMAVLPEYIARKNNPKLVKFLDPRMEKFLDKSYGLIVYQDDLLFCALDLAGYSWEEADKFRKAVGKKIPAEMAAQKEKFIQGIMTNGQTQEFAEHLWKLFEPFQAYGFNKAHAASYGMVAYQTAYMKANFPVEYMCALLTAESGDIEKISDAVAECRHMNISILPPDINESDEGFKIVDNVIRFGFSAIKNIGKAAIESILLAREGGKFGSMTEFFHRVDNQKVNKRVVESLIKAGALDAFGNRPSLLAAIDEIRTKASSKQKQNLTGQDGLFDTQDEPILTHAATDRLPDIPDFTPDEKLSLERELLGFYLTENPLSDSLSLLANLISHKIKDLTPDTSIGQMVKIGGVVTQCRVVTTKKGNREMCFVQLEDDTSEIALVVFPSLYESTKDTWSTRKPILVEGKVEYREDSLSLIVETAKVVEEKENQQTVTYQENNGVILKIPKGTNPQVLIKLNQVLQANKGDQTLIILVENGFGEKRITLPYGISWTRDVQHQLKQLLGS